ncbi:AaceriAFR268Cp [[Ashbya] aceris (nom. inval.)]|nr:AaceriAFR268Cp [[Ashbya] aceris (nom. inval.)]
MSVDGASLGEQLLEASRRNNVELLEAVVRDAGPEIEELINESRDPLGNTCLHLCCTHGSWEALDMILDLDCAIEVDPQNTAGDTPLHAAARYAAEEPEHATFLASNLVQVGADPRVRNKDGLRPVELVHGSELEPLVDVLQGAELAYDTHGEALNADEIEEIDDEPSD